MAGEDWTQQEVETIIKDYFDMLHAEMNQLPYNKSQHRRNIQPLLEVRTDRAIDSKHQNISAVLAKLGQPYIKGYKPFPHYQKILETEVIHYLEEHKPKIETDFELFAQTVPPTSFNKFDFSAILDNEPISSAFKEKEISFRPIKTNFLEKEQNNRSLGENGESFVIEFEKWRLVKVGKENLAEKIEWVSKERGDGAGYDILSKNEDGSDRFIEVKTTKLAKETPIYLTRTELSFASNNPNNFYLYRVFNWGVKPQLFIRQGVYESFCETIPVTYKGYFI